MRPSTNKSRINERLEAYYLSTSERVARLTPYHKGMISLLEKKFRGELM